MSDIDQAADEALLKTKNENLEKEIAELRNQITQMSKADDLFTLITDNVADLIAVVNPEGYRIWNNQAYLTTLGYEPDEIEGTYSLGEIHTEDQPLVKEVFDESVKTGVGRKIEYRVRHKQGHWVELESVARVVTTGDGEVEALVLVARDITQRKRQEEELTRARERESAVTAAATTVKRFNDLISRINEYLKSTEKALPRDSAAEKPLHSAMSCAVEARNLCDELLGSTEGDNLTKEEINVETMLEAVAKKSTSGSMARYELRVSKALPIVKGEYEAIKDVFNSVLQNAVEATQTRGVIQISARGTFFGPHSSNKPAQIKSGRYVCIEIRDQGIGIDPNDLKKIFDPYHTTKKGHSGMGLTTAMATLTAHSGTIQVHSTSAGTVVTMYLPGSVGAPTPIQPPTQEGQEASKSNEAEDTHKPSEKRRVLFMDDDPVLRKFVVPMLTDLGHEVIETSNGDEAVRAYRKSIKTNKPFDILLLDLMVPDGTNGAQALHLIKEMNPNALAIASSGYVDEDIMSDPQHYGFAAVIAKPFNSQRLKEVIESVFILNEA